MQRATTCQHACASNQSVGGAAFAASLCSWQRGSTAGAALFQSVLLVLCASGMPCVVWNTSMCTYVSVGSGPCTLQCVLAAAKSKCVRALFCVPGCGIHRVVIMSQLLRNAIMSEPSLALSSTLDRDRRRFEHLSTYVVLMILMFVVFHIYDTKRKLAVGRTREPLI